MRRASTLLMGEEFCPGYRLTRLRGRGAFGSVWEAETTASKTVALKFLPCSDSLVAAQEIRSVQLIRSLYHTNLTRVEQVWCHRGYVVVTMELADGNLADLLEVHQYEFGTPLSPRILLPCLLQVAKGLDFLNTRQHMSDGQRVSIQHCDVKPSNILIFGDTVKLCDYGLASVTASAMRKHRRAGTFDFAAPEVLLGQLSDRTDQYSLAVTYCALRGGSLPFPNAPLNPERFFYRPEPDLKMLPEGERPIVARGLARQPTDRWNSSTDMIAALIKKTGSAHDT